LASFENVWLEGIAENNIVGISLMLSDFETGLAGAQKALALADESGDAALRRACLANLGNVLCEAGQFETAVLYFHSAGTLIPPSGEFAAALSDSIARALFLQGDLEGALRHLNATSVAAEPSNEQLLYAKRHALLTRAAVANEQGLRSVALKYLDTAVEWARKTGDEHLLTLAEIFRFEVSAISGHARGESLPILEPVSNRLRLSPPAVHANYERALAIELARSGEVQLSKRHLTRAERTLKGLRSASGLLELNRGWQSAVSTAPLHDESRESTSIRSLSNRSDASDLLQNVAALLMHVGRPELLARDLLAVLAGSDSIEGAAALARSDDGTLETIDAEGEVDAIGERPADRRFALGQARNRQIEVAVRPRGDLESLATVQAVSMLVDTIHDLEHAQADREQQLTLWPVDELPATGDEAVITGRMREIMTYARRVARTSASVLITGESGTGKEIVARAIHAHSTRADKPFVPFNCTAVPRDMLESQLFGHRRGAFTGADRDYAGLIRSARDGTLFLDEIGEMGLDLQPKLLRFLESGEISPLGEPGPLSVNVRIVAATNANLDDMVRQGRFREDLFYRLNVIRLTLPPLRERRDEIPALVHHFLASATAEFGKGRVRLAEETVDHLLLYDWPGNVRQLQNEIRRMVALAENDALLTPAALSPELRRATTKAVERQAPGAIAFTIAPGEKLPPAVSRIEREMIRAALRASHGRVDAAAKALGISRKGLYLKRQRLGL
jgi:DNA-binding NtrC family response regulator